MLRLRGLSLRKKYNYTINMRIKYLRRMLRDDIMVQMSEKFQRGKRKWHK